MDSSTKFKFYFIGRGPNGESSYIWSENLSISWVREMISVGECIVLGMEVLEGTSHAK